jgi:hypothetical protein
MVQPWMIARCPTVTPSPMVHGKPMSVWSTDSSWMLVSRPMVMRSWSPRITTPNQTPTPSPSVTLPMTVAVGAIQ